MAMLATAPVNNSLARVRAPVAELCAGLVSGAPGRIRQVVRALALVGVQDLADAADIGVLRVRLEHLVQARVLQRSVGDNAVRKAALVGDGLQPGGLRE
jgi:hypothetical protein